MFVAATDNCGNVGFHTFLTASIRICVVHWVFHFLFLLIHSFIHSFIHSSIPLACAECDNSLPFSGASSIPLCYTPFSSTLFHQLVFQPPSFHLAIYFLVYLSASLFPNSYKVLLGGGGGILFSSILCT